jgi:poly(A)-specific ribonuclease
MEVTRDNFATVYPKFKELLATCKFLSFDEEMTGIWATGDGMQQKRDDTPQIRYSKMIDVATKYSIIQFGVCLFHEAVDGSSWTATPYNFYLFPNTGGDMVMSPSSIDFLRKNGMDFNVWIGKGITFVDEKGEQYYKNRLLPSDADKEAKQLIVPTRPSDIEYTAQSMGKVATMLAAVTAPDALAEDLLAGSRVEATGEVVLLPANSYLRRILYEQLEAQFPDRVNVSKNEQGHLVVRPVQDAAAQEALLAAQRAEKERQYYDTLGFRRVFTDLVDSKVPIVGHNLFFDLLFMMRWLDQPLPVELDDFRENLHTKFPSIYDTKYISALEPDGTALDNTALEACYKHYVLGEKTGDKGADSAAKIATERVTITISEWVQGYDPSDPHYHNAGYDAYVTGCVFANQVHLLPQWLRRTASEQAGANSSDVDMTGTERSDPPVGVTANLHAAQEHWGNVINMMRSCYHLQLNPQLPAGRMYLPGTLLHVNGFDGAKTNNTSVMDFLTGLKPPLAAGQFEVMWVDKEAFMIHLPQHTMHMRPAQQEEGAQEDMWLAGPNILPAEVAPSDSEDHPSHVEICVHWPADWKVVTFEQYQEDRRASAAQATGVTDEKVMYIRCRMQSCAGDVLFR